jgi:hypothetical protein
MTTSKFERFATSTPSNLKGHYLKEGKNPSKNMPNHRPNSSSDYRDKIMGKYCSSSNQSKIIKNH